MNNWTKVFNAIDFAARRHAGQTRKGSEKTPYINHPISVVSLLSKHGEHDPDLLSAAALHDVIEDTAKDKDEISKLSSTVSEKFGERVLEIVLEVSDDKSLPFHERKQLQIINTPHHSNEAKKLKIADKTCNIKDLIGDPPDNWDQERKTGYLEWAKKVIDGARGVNDSLEKHFDDTIIKAYDVLSKKNKQL
jgi:(p)ppGpp synthase/HD superfamily hydrolase